MAYFWSQNTRKEILQFCYWVLYMTTMPGPVLDILVILSLHTLEYLKHNYYNSDSTYQSKYEVIINIELYIIFSSILICMLENKHIYCSLISEHYVYNQQVLLLELVKFKVHVYTFQYIMHNIWCKSISHMKKT